MNVYKTEEEQVDDIKRWARAYGPSLIVGIILAIAITFGWRYWQSYQTKRFEQASHLYQQLIEADQQQKTEAITTVSTELQSDYPKTPYAAFAAMIKAKNAVNGKDYQQAIEELQWIASHDSNHDLTAIAKLRIARIQLELKQQEDALTTLDSINGDTYASMISYAKGNIYSSLKQYKKAATAYQQAIEEAPNPQDLSPMVQIKLDNLPITDAGDQSA